MWNTVEGRIFIKYLLNANDQTIWTAMGNDDDNDGDEDGNTGAIYIPPPQTH